MLGPNRIIGAGLAAILGLGMLAMPGKASAQWYRHRSRTHSEDSARNNAIALGAAGLILMNSHENTLGTIALAGAALEVGQMQHDIDNRHDRYGYRYNSRYNDRYYGYNDGYRGRRGDGDGDRDDRYYGNNGNGYGYGYGRRRGDGDHDRDDRRSNRRRGDSWYNSVIRNGNHSHRDRDHDGD